MQLAITSDVDLATRNTLQIPCVVDHFTEITDPSQLPEAAAFAAQHHLPLLPLGSGSNIVLGRSRLHCLAIHLAIPGRTLVRETKSSIEIRIGAGEDWDSVVRWAVERNLRGIESLSIIPGTVGAAPVQNIGAYGQELRETLVNVEAYDLTTRRQVTLTNPECEFGYRDSIFKHAGKGRYIITAVTLRLVPAELAPPPTYASLQAELARRQITEPTVSEIREAVIAVRRSKLPDPATTPTVGSFFQLPIVSATKLRELQAAHPDIPNWPMPDGKVKLAAGWLIEQCGLKGVMRDGVGLYDKQALVLINPGHKPAAEVLAFRDYIIAAVQERFGVTLNMEPELISL